MWKNRNGRALGSRFKVGTAGASGALFGCSEVEQNEVGLDLNMDEHFAHNCIVARALGPGRQARFAVEPVASCCRRF
jgi:hypothetical protein